MKIVKEEITLDELRQMMLAFFGDMVKAVVDVDSEILAVDGELHSDLEALLLEHGSRQSSLWGINFYPDLQGEDFIEFDSMINVRPSQGNRSRSVNDEKIRQRIRSVVVKRVVR